jgi:hypothetical protein
MGQSLQPDLETNRNSHALSQPTHPLDRSVAPGAKVPHEMLGIAGDALAHSTSDLVGFQRLQRWGARWWMLRRLWPWVGSGCCSSSCSCGGGSSCGLNLLLRCFEVDHRLREGGGEQGICAAIESCLPLRLSGSELVTRGRLCTLQALAGHAIEAVAAKGASAGSRVSPVCCPGVPS